MALGHGGLVCFPLLRTPWFPQVRACWDLKSLSPRLRLMPTPCHRRQVPSWWVSCRHHVGTERLGRDWWWAAQGPCTPTHRRFRRTGIARKPVSHPARRLSQQPDRSPALRLVNLPWSQAAPESPALGRAGAEDRLCSFQPGPPGIRGQRGRPTGWLGGHMFGAHTGSSHTCLAMPLPWEEPTLQRAHQLLCRALTRASRMHPPPRSTLGGTQEPDQEWDPIQQGRVLRDPRIPLRAPLHWGRKVAGNLVPFRRFLSHANERFVRGSFPAHQISRVCPTSMGPLKMKAS